MAQDDIPFDEPLELPDAPKRSTNHKKRRFPLKKFVAVVCAVALLGAGGFGAYVLLHHHKQPTGQKDSPVAQDSLAPSKLTDVAPATTMKTFSNSLLAYSVTYPSSWTLTQTADYGTRIESPTFIYQTVDKGPFSGNFRVYIRQQARPVDETYIGRGVAVEPSQVLSYTKPASDQRQTTYLTFFGLDNPNQFAYFLIAGNFNLNKGDSLGPTYGNEQGTFIISGGYSSPTLKDDMQTNQVPLSYFKTTNAYKQAVAIVASLQL